MINAESLGAVTHIYTHGNLINNKKINIYAIFMYFLCGKIYKYGVFFVS